MTTNEVQDKILVESQSVELAPSQEKALESLVIEVVPEKRKQRKTLIPDELLPRVFPANGACQSNDY
jgi:hypothetical protein